MTAAFLEYEARGERARIARELHDVVAHHISMIAVQAETARLATPGMPPHGARQLLAIGDTARTALTEMRRLLGVLREDTDTDTTRQPQPGLHQLVELVDDARASGSATTRLVVRGCVAPLDPGIELTVYRIVQEALTNARRHAPAAAVDVELDYAADALLVRVGTTVRDRPVRSRATAPPSAATASWGCASGLPPSAASCGSARRRSAASSSRPVYRHGRTPETTPDEPRAAAAHVVVDDQDVVRAGLAALLGTQPDFTVVATAADGARRCGVPSPAPDVVLMDIRMPALDGVQATAGRPPASEGPVPRVLVLTTFDLDENVYYALGAGASGFLLKDMTAERLFDAVRVVAAGGALLAPTVTRRLIAEFARQRPRPTREPPWSRP